MARFTCYFLHDTSLIHEIIVKGVHAGKTSAREIVELPTKIVHGVALAIVEVVPLRATRVKFTLMVNQFVAGDARCATLEKIIVFKARIALVRADVEGTTLEILIVIRVVFGIRTSVLGSLPLNYHQVFRVSIGGEIDN